MRVKNKLPRIVLHRIKKEIPDDLVFDDVTFAPNLYDPLNFYDIRFYRKRHILHKITINDKRVYLCVSVRQQLKKYFYLDDGYYGL